VTALWVLAIVLALFVAIGLVWRRETWPCPAWLVPLLENPYFQSVAGAEALLDRAGVREGLRVLDAGCGPGRVAVPAARRVGRSGRVVAVDLQAGMLRRVAQRIERAGLDNVELVHAGLGEGKLSREIADVALMVTVLGEIPDKPAALREIHDALRPGGVLSITEVLPDPHYQREARVRELLRAAGFVPGECVRKWSSYTLNAARPGVDEP